MFQAPLVRYRNILGIPNTGFHANRFLGMAARDFFGTIGIALILSFFMGSSFIFTFLLLFLTAIGIHFLFGVNTAFINSVFGMKFDENGFLVQIIQQPIPMHENSLNQ